MTKVKKSTAVPIEKSDDKQLARYRSMRDFGVTNEPSGEHKSEKAGDSSALPFVIQKHAATRLHYDFRLCWNGVLKSWAVAKGPSYFTGDKRLAVQVEDHPLDYGGFEGIIPKGQYGGGTVMLWDRGTWEPHGDVDEGLRKGSLKFALHGEKLKGNWALVRMNGRAANESKPNWLLIKEHDQQERSQQDTPITDEAPDSVLSGRDLTAIANDRDRVWNSNRSQPAEAQASPAATKAASSKTGSTPRKQSVHEWSKELIGAAKESLPKFIPPQLAALAKAPPSGDRWMHEIKLDGYRIQARIGGKKSKVQLLTRTGLDWTHRMNSLVDALAELPVESAVIDGEVVVLGPDGTSSFADLQAAFQEGTKHALTYFAFDLLHLDGHNLRDLPLLGRKDLLQEVLSKSDLLEYVRLSEHIFGDADQIFHKACDLGTEGIVSKLAAATYSSGRGGGWLKIKCYQEQELVIGGFTLPSNGIYGVGALLLGYYRDGVLVYAGRTGTGFTQNIHRLLRDRLDRLRTTTMPFTKTPADAGRGVHWVKPALVAQVSFSTWTADNLVRQAAFKGLREDKSAKSVYREEAQISTKHSVEKKSNSLAASHGDSSKEKKSNVGRPATSDLPIRLTHPEKVLDATTGITKDALARYYLAVAEYVLRYVADRPLTLVRCLEGSEKPCFYQKHKNKMLSGNFGSIEIVDKKSGKPEPYITLNSPESIVELAQIGVLELHPWGSRNEAIEQPDQIIFDLDPDAAIDWRTIAESAMEIRKRLKAMGIKSFVKTTGGKGLHVVFPIRPEHTWPEVKEFAHKFVLAMEKDNPSLFLTKMTKAARIGKVYLDYLRNERGATAVAPFSPRARTGLPVAMPLSWSELKSESRPQFQVSDFEKWKKRLARDPWKEMQKTDQRLHLQ